MNSSHRGLLATPGGETWAEWQGRKSSYDDDIEFLKAHHFLQDGLMFDHLMVGVGDIAYGNADWTEDVVWNNAVPPGPDPNIILKLDYQYVNKWCRRRMALYFPKTDAFEPLERRLSGEGWSEETKDEWMIYKGQPPDPSASSDTVEEVQTGDEFAVFIDTLRHAHDDTDPHTNPYGPLSIEQADAIARVWDKGYKSGNVKYFVVYDRERGAKERIPVAVASLTSWADRFGRRLGHIANLGVDPSNRRHGYGTGAALSCISAPALAACVLGSFRQGNVVHSLATAPGKGPREAFAKMGFETKVTAAIWLESDS